MTRPRARGRATIPESAVLKGCLAALRAYGIESKRRNVGAMRNASGRLVRFGEPGDSDVLATLPGGRVMELEVKRPGERPRPEQLEKLRRCNELGGCGLWIDDPGELARILPRLINGATVDIDEHGNQWIEYPDA